MEPTLKVTVILAHYNYEQYLEEAIQSVLNQTYKCALCLVDDGSENIEIVNKIVEKTLGVGEVFYICDEYEEYKHGIHTVIYKKSNSGPSKSRNIAINSTIHNTDYYVILDADDKMYTSKVAKMLWRITEYNYGAIYADYDILNVETGIKIREFKYPYSLSELHKHCIVHSGAMISKEALLFAQEIDPNKTFFDERLRCAEDYDLWLRISKKYIIGHIPIPLTLVRVHKKNSTNSVDKSIWNQCLNIVRQKYNG